MSETLTVAMIEGMVSRAKGVVPTVPTYRGYYFFPIEMNDTLSNNEKDALIEKWEVERPKPDTVHFDLDATCGNSETITGS